MIEHIEAFLTERIGLHVPSIGRSAVTRAVRMRMRDTRLTDEQAYWRRLNAEPAEQQSLIDAVVVPETSFFRYPDSFTALAEHASSRRDPAPLRILSLPCATGEEPYSIAMTLLDAGLPATRIRIDALDISPRVLRIAEAARYPARAFRGNDARCAHHFSVSAGEYELNAQARDCVSFHLGNVLDPALPAALGAPFDIVFCRNLLIYFDAPTRSTAIDALKRMLRPDGILFAAPAEAGLLTEAGLHSIGQRQAVTFTHARPQPAPSPRPFANPPRHRPRPSVKRGRLSRARRA